LISLPYAMCPEQAIAVDPDEELVSRRRLLDRLREDRGRTVLLCAPSGYGKSVLLGQLAERDQRPVATVLLTRQHNDPVALVEAIAAALAPSGPLPEDVFDALQAPQPDVENVVVPRLLAGLAARPEACLLILDELERIDSADSLAILAALFAGMPPGSQLAAGSRVDPPLRIGSLRAKRRLTELRREDLTMTKAESGSLLAAVGLDLTPKQLDAIVRRTEGWPAALYLAGLALAEATDPGRAISRFTGDDRVLVDYLEEEFLLPASRRRLAFLRQAAMLERMSGELCDRALESEGSATTLRELARSNMLLIPLDRNGDWYRFHPLLREMLRSDLRRAEPGVEEGIHLRASGWWAARGEWDQAIAHAIEAGAPDRAGELVWAAVPEYMSKGRLATVDAWLEALGPAAVDGEAALSLTAAWSALTIGHGPRAEHCCAVTERLLRASEPGEARTALEAGLALAEAALGRGGLEATRARISALEPLLPEDAPWRTVTCYADGTALHLLDRHDEARERLLEGARRGSIAAPNLQCLCLAQLGLLYIDLRDWPAAELEVSRAREQAERYGLGEYPMIALVFAVSAHVKARRGATDAARADLDAATRLLAQLDHFNAWYEAEARLTMARVAARLGDRGAAAEHLVAARRRLVEIPDDVVLGRWAAEIATAEDGRAAALEEPLTRAELRLVAFLPTHLTFPQIAAESHLSPNTVKTHIRSIYRKLGADSRQSAIERAGAAGLLDELPNAR
jgi:LuxR family transcriptional regulator, maltose regulon positive regulatory protein